VGAGGARWSPPAPARVQEEAGPWADHVRLVEATYDGVWESPPSRSGSADSSTRAVTGPVSVSAWVQELMAERGWHGPIRIERVEPAHQ
jgi:hypothetical protein